MKMESCTRLGQYHEGLEARPAEALETGWIVHGETAAPASPADLPHVNILDMASAGLEAKGVAALPGKKAQDMSALVGCRQGGGGAEGCGGEGAMQGDTR